MVIPQQHGHVGHRFAGHLPAVPAKVGSPIAKLLQGTEFYDILWLMFFYTKPLPILILILILVLVLVLILDYILVSMVVSKRTNITGGMPTLGFGSRSHQSVYGKIMQRLNEECI